MNAEALVELDVLLRDDDGEVRIAAAERAELERLRAEKSKSAREAAEDASIAEARARGRKLMEPDEDDEDLKMPAGQKMVLGIIALVVVVMLLMQFLGGR